MGGWLSPSAEMDGRVEAGESEGAAKGTGEGAGPEEPAEDWAGRGGREGKAGADPRGTGARRWKLTPLQPLEAGDGLVRGGVVARVDRAGLGGHDVDAAVGGGDGEGFAVRTPGDVGEGEGERGGGRGVRGGVGVDLKGEETLPGEAVYVEGVGGEEEGEEVHGGAPGAGDDGGRGRLVVQHCVGLREGEGRRHIAVLIVATRGGRHGGECGVRG